MVSVSQANELSLWPTSTDVSLAVIAILVLGLFFLLRNKRVKPDQPGPPPADQPSVVQQSPPGSHLPPAYHVPMGAAYDNRGSMVKSPYESSLQTSPPSSPGMHSSGIPSPVHFQPGFHGGTQEPYQPGMTGPTQHFVPVSNNLSPGAVSPQPYAYHQAYSQPAHLSELSSAPGDHERREMPS